MKKRTVPRCAYTAMCLVVGLLGLGNILDKDPDTSWATVPIVFIVVAILGFAFFMSWNGGDE